MGVGRRPEPSKDLVARQQQCNEYWYKCKFGSDCSSDQSTNVRLCCMPIPTTYISVLRGVHSTYRPTPHRGPIGHFVWNLFVGGSCVVTDLDFRLTFQH